MQSELSEGDKLRGEFSESYDKLCCAVRWCYLPSSGDVLYTSVGRKATTRK